MLKINYNAWLFDVSTYLNNNLISTLEDLLSHLGTFESTFSDVDYSFSVDAYALITNTCISDAGITMDLQREFLQIIMFLFLLKGTTKTQLLKNQEINENKIIPNSLKGMIKQKGNALKTFLEG